MTDPNEALAVVAPAEIEALPLESAAAGRLLRLVEEATRADGRAIERFVEPASGTLARALSRRHHIVFGRRGSGKTTLLRKASADLARDRVPTAFVDLELLKGLGHVDALASALVATLAALRAWLDSAAVHPASRISFWRKLFGGAPRRPPLDKKRAALLAKALEHEMAELQALIGAEDGAAITEKQTRSRTASRKATLGLVLGTKAPPLETGSLTAGGELAAVQASGLEVSESKKRDKLSQLERRLAHYQKLLDDAAALGGDGVFLFFDDLYHLPRADQPRLLDYFHRLAKGRDVWLGVGTIRHRSAWYRHGDPSVGMKLGDDCDSIDLDVTLERYGAARRFLVQLLDDLAREAGAGTHAELVSPGGLGRLVLASGGVARDFLTLFRMGVEAARERQGDHLGVRVSATDVMRAAAEHDRNKRDELRRDTREERADLERALAAVRRLCASEAVSCFLVERDATGAAGRAVAELADLRFVHLVASQLTVRALPGRVFSAYMLDLSQLALVPKRPRLVRFWLADERARLRKEALVFDDDALVFEAEQEAKPVAPAG